MKVYIAGPMSGFDQFNRPAFHAAESNLREHGNVVLNPATLPDGLSQVQYMDICLAMLRCADAVYMLAGWENSAGARAEHALAEKLELLRFYQGGRVA
ncbi:nucleoside 2-deoxyribosyltransferase [Kosakonia cowanii]|nr:nucleoside 2-deoxyribosyltransferase [Kosakonia cowanii]